MLDLKRNITEVISLYMFEEEIADIYVEGPTDKSIIENYLEYKEINKNVIEIETIDFDTYKDKFDDLDLRSNKDKLIAFARILKEQKIKNKIDCVIDKDFDELIENIEENDYIMYTDFSCIESYFYDEKNISKILKVGIRNFPFDGNHALKEIKNVIMFIFILKYAKVSFNLNSILPKIESNIKIEKKLGTCQFNENDYLSKFINSNKLQSIESDLKKFLSQKSKELKSDYRNYMNGHDFIEILYHYINRIKNTPNFRQENFERAVYLSVQPDHLDKFELFQKLSK